MTLSAASDGLPSDQSVILLKLAQTSLPITHFIGFPDLGERYRTAVLAFGPPAFRHRFWDQRAKRDIAPGDLIVFADGDEFQPIRRFNGDDQFYDPDPTEPKGEIK